MIFGKGNWLTGNRRLWENDAMITRLLLTVLLTFPLLLSAETIVVKTKAPKNLNAVFQYRVPKGYDRNRREMYRVLVFFGGRNTDGKADASGRMGWGKWCDDNGDLHCSPILPLCQKKTPSSLSAVLRWS